MRAWQLQSIGDPLEELELVDIPEPEPRAEQLTVEVGAAGLAFPDVLLCRGEYQMPTPDGFIPGGECAGTVVEVGAAVDGDFEPGDRVVVLGGPGLTERIAVMPTSAWKIPEKLSFEKAAAIPVNYGTTWFALHDRAEIAEGESLLVVGAAGGTGSAAIQLGKAAGATVIAVAGGAEKCAQASTAGADHVIDHHETPQFVDAVRDLSGGGVDVAYDPVGGDTTHQIRRCMGWDGRLLIIGFVAGIPDLPANHALLKNYSIVGVHWGASVARDPSSVDRQLRSVLDLVPAGAVDPLVFPPYGFDDGARALQDLADRKTWGKAVVTI